MEEDNDDITGWDDHDYKILDPKTIKKHKKKVNSIISQDEQLQRKLKPSRTLPFIKNKPALIIEEPPTQTIDKNQTTSTDKLQRKLLQRIVKTGKGQLLKDYLDNLDSHDSASAPQITPKLPERIAFEDKESKQTETQEGSSFQKKSGQVKHGSTVVKVQKISQIEKLKIQANDYASSTKNTPRPNVQKTEMLKKITKGSLANLSKKEKNKHFIVKRQRISPEQLQEEVSKMAIQLKKPETEEGKMSPKSPRKQRRANFMKEKHRYFLKPDEQELERQLPKQKEKKKKVVVKSQRQQITNSTHVRRYTNVDVARITHKNQKEDTKKSTCKDGAFHECIGLKQQDGTVKKSSKWDQVLKEVENEAKTLKKLKDQQKKLFKAAKQAGPGFLPNFNQKNSMIEMMVTKKLRKDIINAESKVINSLKKTLMNELGHDNYTVKKQKTLFTEGSLCYDEFNDECLFYNKSGNDEGRESKNY